MAYDITDGSCCARDWSIGAGEADTLKKETWTIPQIRGLADLVEREINHNVALANKRLGAGTMDKKEGTAFAEFARSFKTWRTAEMAAGKKLTGETAEKLKQWRRQNAEWTGKLSEGSKSYVLVTRTVGLVAVVEKKHKRWPWLAGAAGLFGLGWFFGKR